MKATITVQNHERSNHQIVVNTTFGDPIRISPNETQVIDLYEGHTVTSIEVGAEVAKDDAETGLQLTEQQKIDVQALLNAYPDHVVGVGKEDGQYKIVDQSGNVFAEGTMDDLVKKPETVPEDEQPVNEPEEANDAPDAAPESAPDAPVEDSEVAKDDAPEAVVEAPVEETPAVEEETGRKGKKHR